MSIKKPNPAANLGPRAASSRTRVADTFRTPSDATTKLTHRIPEDLHRRFKRVAVDVDRPMGEIVVDLISKYVAEHENTG